MTKSLRSQGIFGWEPRNCARGTCGRSTKASMAPCTQGLINRRAPRQLVQEETIPDRQGLMKGFGKHSSRCTFQADKRPSTCEKFSEAHMDQGGIRPLECISQ